MRPGIVFDVDDTLYFEANYVRSGFRAVSRFLSRTTGAPFDDVCGYLLRSFEQGVRDTTFDRLLKAMPQLATQVDVPQLVEVYRAHSPEISLLPGMRELLEDLSGRGARLAAVTDGPLESQRRKVAALELDRFLEDAVLTDRWGREYWKPNPRAFEHLAERWGLPPDRLVYVGDNPEKDFLAPNRLGWWTIRLRLPGQLRADRETHPAELASRLTVSSVDDLAKSLRAWIRRNA